MRLEALTQHFLSADGVGTCWHPVVVTCASDNGGQAVVEREKDRREFEKFHQRLLNEKCRREHKAR